ncbi:MAG: aminotransferase class I/II-fold pyridoxal phosphate-dependent enzyme [Dolichospermum sp.]
MKELSLADFLKCPHFDINQRAVAFSKMYNDFFEKKHFQYKRVALNASSPLRVVKDLYTGEHKEMIYLASNDYLNLTTHPKVIEAGIQALIKYGSGAGSVPLLGGTLDIHIELEQKIATFKGCESAIIYTSGFSSNSSTLLSLLQQEDIAILDMFVHASIIDGCKGTNTKFFKHNDIDSLEKTLKNCKDSYRTKIIAIDGVYSMDGDIAPLDKIVEVAKKYDAYIFVDEAHATGVIGKNGRGTLEYYKVEGEIDLVSGTFSKALGGVGGFITGKKELIELLNFYSRSYMFSTAMSPATCASLLAAIDVIETEPEIRDKLWNNIFYFRQQLKTLGFNIGNSETAIFPIIIGDDFKTKEICRELHEMNIYVNPVLYPAVPKRLARVRISLMSNHEKKHLDAALNALEYLGKKYSII